MALRRRLPRTGHRQRRRQYPPILLILVWCVALWVFSPLDTRAGLDVDDFTLKLQEPMSFYYSSPGHARRMRRRSKNMRQRTHQHKTDSLPKNRHHQRPIVFLHVGKTGGETIRNTLRVTCVHRPNPVRRSECLDRLAHYGESALSQHTIASWHGPEWVGGNATLLQDPQTVLLWSVRNPIDRVASWFHYSHPSNCQPDQDSKSMACTINGTIVRNVERMHSDSTKQALWATRFFGCFATWQDFAVALSSEPHSTCAALAWKTLQGQTSIAANHLLYSYRYYWNQTLLAKSLNSLPTVHVIRTEHLWSDLQGMESILSNTRDKPFSYEQYPNETHGSERQFTRRSAPTLSPTGRQRMCCALYQTKELIIYHQLVEMAQNLLPDDKAETLAIFYQSCGVVSWENLETLCSHGYG